MSKVLIIGGGAAGMRKMTVWEENYSSPGRDAAILRMQGTWKPCLLP